MIVTVEDAKAHLNVTDDADDDLIAKKIAAAEAWVGSYIGFSLTSIEAFPDGAPEPLKEAVRMLTAHLYENREASIVGVTMSNVSPGIFDLMAPYKEVVL